MQPFYLRLFILLQLSALASAAAATATATHSRPLPPDAVALLSLKSSIDPHDLLPFFASSHRPHCHWLGVRCSSFLKPRAVTRLVVESLPLRGTLPSHFPSHLDQLRLLSLKNTSLRGPIPDLSPFPNLKALFLSHNSLSGSLPSSLPSRLHSLDLSRNLLSGHIPSSLSSSPASLAVLLLHHNRLTGAVPAFSQRSLRALDLSSNNLSGALPSSPLLLSFPTSAFSLNPALCGQQLNRPCSSPAFFPLPPPPPPHAKSSHSSTEAELRQIRLPPEHHRRWRKTQIAAIAAGIAGAAAVLVVIAGAAATAARRGRARATVGPKKGADAAAAAADAMEISEGDAMVVEETREEKVRRMGKSGCLVFTAGENGAYGLEELMRASAEMMGRGTVGSTYKAVIDGRLILSVKRVDAGRMGSEGRDGFEGRMEMVGRLRHPNLVPLRAYLQAKEERLIVYDYHPNGSLFSLIHGSKSTRSKPLHWTSCLKIAEDVAQGLAYIHQASRLVHGNIKSSNILLGSEFEACLTDCCLASLVELVDGEEDSGYRAPETRNSNRNLTTKSDIYSFGILLLEILTGKPPLPNPFLVATDLPVWVRSIREDDGHEDERLGMLLDIAAQCIRSVPESRPSTWQVLRMIQEVKESDAGDEGDAKGITL